MPALHRQTGESPGRDYRPGGRMEFPELGTHCASPNCSRLDFLPIECDACHQIFCKEHSAYDKHNCEQSYTKDARVPVCPLCNQPVPIRRGEDPNIKVNEHIQNECKSDKAQKNYSNRCSFAGCKKKELVPVKCTTCQKNFCFKHRFETDHDCQGHPHRLGGRQAPNRAPRQPASNRGRGTSSGGGARSGVSKPQQTTMSQIGAELNRERQLRQQQRWQQPQQHHPSSHHSAGPSSSVQPQMSEDEALAQAIAASMSDSAPPSSNPHPTQSVQAQTHLKKDQKSTCDEDEELARAIAASLNEDQPKPKPRTRSTNREQKSKDSDCVLS